MKRLSVKEIITDLRKSANKCHDERGRFVRCGSSMRAELMMVRFDVLESHADAYAAGRLVNEQLDK